MSDVLAELKALVHQRGEHEIAIQQIDAKLLDARRLLGMSTETVAFRARIPSAAPLGRPSKTHADGRRELGLTEERILAALAVREPQTTKMLIRAVPGITTVQQHLPRLWHEGRLCRRRFTNGGNVYWYARSEAALDHIATRFAENDEGGDLEQPEPCAVAAGNTSGMATSPITSPATLEAE